MREHRGLSGYRNIRRHGADHAVLGLDKCGGDPQPFGGEKAGGLGVDCDLVAGGDDFFAWSVKRTDVWCVEKCKDVGVGHRRTPMRAARNVFSRCHGTQDGMPLFKSWRAASAGMRTVV